MALTQFPITTVAFPGIVDATLVGAVRRPGEMPGAYKNTISGAPTSGTVYTSGSVINDAVLGDVIRLTTATNVAPRAALVPVPGRVYAGLFSFSRATDPSDPVGDGVEYGVRWLQADQSVVIGTRVVDTVALTVAMGAQHCYATFSLDVAGVDYTIPAGTVNARPFVRTFGTDHATNIGMVALVDITEGFLAQANNENALDRANHTGTQAISTVDGLQTALDAKAPQSEIDRIAIADVTRPGENPSQFSDDLTGDPEDRTPLDAANVAVDDDAGSLWDLVGAGIVAPRRAYAIETGRVYKLRVKYRRRVDSTDPSGDAVQVKWRNLGKNKATLTTATINTMANPLVATGIIEITALISTDSGVAGVTVVPSGTARYGVPYIETFGDTPTTGIIAFEWSDVTGLVLGGADVEALTTGLAAETTARTDADTAEAMAREDGDAALAASQTAARVADAIIRLDVADMAGTGDAMVGTIPAAQSGINLINGRRIQAYIPTSDSTVVSPTLTIGATEYSVQSRLGGDLVPGALVAGRRYDFVQHSAAPAVLTLMGAVQPADVGLGNVDDTSDADKPISTAQATKNAILEAQALPYANRAAAEAADIPAPVVKISVRAPNGSTLAYVENAAAVTPALTNTPSGRKFVPDGQAYFDHFAENTTPGTTNMTPAGQAGAEYLTSIGGGDLWTRDGVIYALAVSATTHPISGTRTCAIALRAGVVIRGGGVLKRLGTAMNYDLIVGKGAGTFPAISETMGVRDVTIDGSSGDRVDGQAGTGGNTDGFNLWLVDVQDPHCQGVTSIDAASWGVRIERCLGGKNIGDIRTKHGPDVNADGVHFIDCSDMSAHGFDIYTEGDDGFIIEAKDHDIANLDFSGIVARCPVGVPAAGRGVLVFSETLGGTRTTKVTMDNIRVQAVSENCGTASGSGLSVSTAYADLLNSRFEIIAKGCTRGAIINAGNATEPGTIRNSAFIIQDANSSTSPLQFSVGAASGSVMDGNHVEIDQYNPADIQSGVILRGDRFTGWITVDYDPLGTKVSKNSAINALVTKSTLQVTARGGLDNINLLTGCTGNTWLLGNLSGATTDLRLNGTAANDLFIGGSLATTVGVTAATKFIGTVGANNALFLGDYGVGSANLELVTDWNSIARLSGVRRTNSTSTTGTLPGGYSGFDLTGTLHENKYDSGSYTQMWISIGKQEVWFRRYTAASWGAWKKLAAAIAPGPYADDAAAATGGVVVGETYRVTGGNIAWRVS